MSAREQLLTLKLRDVPVFTQYALVGWHIGRLQPGEVLRVHQFEYSNSNGDEIIASPFARVKLLEVVADVIDRVRFPATTAMDGGDLLVRRAA